MEMVRLDDFAREAGIQHIHLLKVDTEEFELDVLRGSEGLLDRGAIDLVLAECDFHAVKQPHARFRDLHAFVERKGYMFVTLYTEYADDEVGFGYGSALFKRRTTCRATATASNLSQTTCHPSGGLSKARVHEMGRTNMHLRRVTEQLSRPAPRHVSDMWKVMISGLVRRSVMRIGRSPERVMPPHIAMHAVAQIERCWGGPELGLLPALVRRIYLAIDSGAANATRL
jgi:Methyltransferase FkbM domain